MENDFYSQNPAGFTEAPTHWFNKKRTQTLKFISSIFAFGLMLAFITVKVASIPLFSWLKEITTYETFSSLFDCLYTIFALGLPIILTAMIFKSDKEIKSTELFPLEEPISKNLFLLAIPAGVALCVSVSSCVSQITAIFRNFAPVESTTFLAPDGGINILLMFIRTAFIPAIFEELLFRGVLLQPLRKYGDMFAIFVTSLFFGLFHGSFSQILFAIPAGFILAYFTIKTGTLWTSICIHFFNNSIACIESIINKYDNTYLHLGHACFIIALSILGFIAFVFFLINKRKSIKLYNPKTTLSFSERDFFKKQRRKIFFVNAPMIIITVLLSLNFIYSSFSSTILNFIRNLS